jgi:predicted permease
VDRFSAGGAAGSLQSPARVTRDVVADLRYGLRQFARAPVFTLFALLTLTLVIGVNAALFSLLDAALARPLPVSEPDRLVSVIVTQRNGGWLSNVPEPLFAELRNGSTAFTAVFAYWNETETVRWKGQAEHATAQLISGPFYEALGVQPFIGRLLTSADGQKDAQPAAVLEYGYWMQRFGGDPATLGQSISVGGVAHTIVGVTPPQFFGLDRAVSPAVTIPMSEPERLANVWLVARLADSKEMMRARVEVQRAWVRALEQLRPTIARYPEDSQQEILALRADILPARTAAGGMNLRAHVPALAVLGTLSTAVLLVGCANLATLLLARASMRAAEMRTRHAVGASRGRLIRQLLLESGLLAVAGALLGAMFGVLAHGVLVRFLLGQDTPAGMRFELDVRLLLFLACLTTATTLAFGLAPALRLSSSPWFCLQPGQLPPRRARVDAALVVGQVATCLILLVASVSLARTLGNLRTMNRGFSGESLVLVPIGATDRPYVGDRSPAHYERLRAVASRVSGVEAVGLAANQVFGSGSWTKKVWLDRASLDSGDADFNVVTPGFFDATVTAFLHGRDFATHDTIGAPKVAIVNATFARRYCAHEAVGCRFGDEGPASRRKYEVIGVVADAKYGSLRAPSRPMVYEPLLADEQSGAVTLHARVRGKAALVGARIQAALLASDPALPVYEVKTIEQQLEESLRSERMMSTVSGF